MLTELPVYAVPLGPVALEPFSRSLPLGAARASLGFPSPAEDFEDDALDLNDLLIRNPPATFLYRAEGHSMLMAGICDGDILVVDRSVTPAEGDLVLAIWDGNQPVCKVLKVADDHVELHSRNPHFQNIRLDPETEVELFAIVAVVRQVKRSARDVRTHRR